MIKTDWPIFHPAAIRAATTTQAVPFLLRHIVRGATTCFVGSPTRIKTDGTDRDRTGIICRRLRPWLIVAITAIPSPVSMLPIPSDMSDTVRYDAKRLWSARAVSLTEETLAANSGAAFIESQAPAIASAQPSSDSSSVQAHISDGTAKAQSQAQSAALSPVSDLESGSGSDLKADSGPADLTGLPMHDVRVDVAPNASQILTFMPAVVPASPSRETTLAPYIASASAIAAAQYSASAPSTASASGSPAISSSHPPDISLVSSLQPAPPKTSEQASLPGQVPMPEPSSLLLFSAAACVLEVFRRLGYVPQYVSRTRSVSVAGAK